MKCVVGEDDFVVLMGILSLLILLGRHFHLNFDN